MLGLNMTGCLNNPGLADLQGVPQLWNGYPSVYKVTFFGS